jgi:solute carrier family 25 phosphate transporter 3
MTSTIEKALPPKPKIELYSGKYFLACGFGGIVGNFPNSLNNLPKY